jgi:hypothetical protein
VTRRAWRLLSGISTLVLIVVLVVVDGRMRVHGGEGMVAFELAGSSARAGEILAAWGQDGQDAARLSLWLDFPFLIAYAAFFTFAIAAVRTGASARAWSDYARVGAVVVVLPIVAAVLDVVEDVALLLVLDGHVDSAAPTIAAGFALAKFAALIVSLVYLVVGFVALLVRRA